MTSVLALVSGKGGVGKTTTAVNLGVGLAARKKVLMIDGNITTANLGLHLDILKPALTIHDVLDGKHSWESAVVKHASGVDIIPASLVAGRESDSSRLRQLTDVIRKSGAYDVVLIDGAAGIGGEVVDSLIASDGFLVVTIPELPTITGAIKVIETANRYGIPPVGIVVNRVKRKKHEIGFDEIAESCESTIVAAVPEDGAVSESIGARKPLVLYRPRSAAALAFSELATKMGGVKTQKRPGILERIKELLLGG